MARVSEQSLGWALLTSACLGLAFVATVARPSATLDRRPSPTPTSLASPETPVAPTQQDRPVGQPRTSQAATTGAQTIMQDAPIRRSSLPTLKTTAASTTTTLAQPIPTSTTTTTTQPFLEMAMPSAHTVGYVEQPLAATATYALNADLGGTVTLKNASSAPLLVTVDLGPADLLNASSSVVLSLNRGMHKLVLAATSERAQSYLLDARLVTW